MTMSLTLMCLTLSTPLKRPTLRLFTIVANTVVLLLLAQDQVVVSPLGSPLLAILHLAKIGLIHPTYVVFAMPRLIASLAAGTSLAFRRIVPLELLPLNRQSRSAIPRLLKLKSLLSMMTHPLLPQQLHLMIRTLR
jgi:hypothetical protein